MEWVMRMLQQNGFTLRVCEDFVDGVEKTVQAGYIPKAENEHDSDRQLWR